MKNLRRQALKTLLLALSAPTIALAQTTAGGAAPPVRIGMIEGLSGAFANAGEAVYRNLVWAVERVNARGGVKTAQGLRRLHLERFDSKGQNEEALSALRAAIDSGVQVVLQGNSSATAGGAESTPSTNTTNGNRRGACCSSTTPRSIPRSPTKNAASGISALTPTPTCAWRR